MSTKAQAVATTTRVWLGIEVPDQVKQEIEVRLQMMRGVGKKVLSDRWHMPVFLVGVVTGIEDKLEMLSKPLPQPFVPIITLTHLGRSLDKDQIWAYGQTKGIELIQHQLAERVKDFKIESPVQLMRDTDYAPHINVADVNEKKMPKISIDIPIGSSFPISTVQIYSSRLWREGASYFCLGTIQLN